MPEEDKSSVPASVLRVFYLILFLMGLIILVIWEAVYLIPEKIYYDGGLFSVCILLLAFGGIGYLLYGEMEKKEAHQDED